MILAVTGVNASFTIIMNGQKKNNTVILENDQKQKMSERNDNNKYTEVSFMIFEQVVV